MCVVYNSLHTHVFFTYSMGSNSCTHVLKMNTSEGVGCNICEGFVHLVQLHFSL